MEKHVQNQLPPKSPLCPRYQYVEIDLSGDQRSTVPSPPLSLITPVESRSESTADIIARANALHNAEETGSASVSEAPAHSSNTTEEANERANEMHATQQLDQLQEPSQPTNSQPGTRAPKPKGVCPHCWKHNQPEATSHASKRSKSCPFYQKEVADDEAKKVREQKKAAIAQKRKENRENHFLAGALGLGKRAADSATGKPAKKHKGKHGPQLAESRHSI